MIAIDIINKVLSTGNYKLLLEINRPEDIESIERVRLINNNLEDYLIYAPCYKAGLIRFIYEKMADITKEEDAWDLVFIVRNMRGDSFDKIFNDKQFAISFLSGLTMNFSDELYDEVYRLIEEHLPDRDDISVLDDDEYTVVLNKIQDKTFNERFKNYDY